MIQDNTNKTNRLMLLGILFFILFFFSSTQIGSPHILKLLGADKVDLRILFLSRIYLWIGLILLGLYAAKIEKQRLVLWENHEYKIYILLLHIVLLYIVVILMLVPVRMLTAIYEGNEISSKMILIKQLLLQNKLMLPLIAVTAGVVEEYAFRAYLQPRMEILFKNAWLSILVTSLLFGAIHYNYGTLTNVAGPFVIGIIFSVYYRKYRNIYALIICHTLIDLIALTAMLHNPHF